jgi:hypothetical protein
MTDSVNRRRKDGRYPVSGVHSFSAKFDFRQSSFVWHPYSGQNATPLGDFPGLTLPAVLEGQNPIVSSTVLGNFAVEAFNAFHTQVPVEVSIANFFWELRELKDLIPKISRSLTKSLSGGFLAFEFGWKPLLGDLEKLANLTNSVHKRLQYLRESYGKFTRLGFSRDVSADMPTLSEASHYLAAGQLYSVQPNADAQQWRYITVPLNRKVVMRAGGYLYHELQDLDESIKVVGTFLAALGLNNPLQILWQALPYSFVIDWFTQFSTLLDRLAIQPFEGRWEVSDVTTSMKSVVNLRVDQYCMPVSLNVRRVGLAYIQTVRYFRWVGLPVPAVSIIDTGLDPKQQLLAAALLRQRGP